MNFPSGILFAMDNDFKLSALTIGKTYKTRWQVELLFNWIKQNLETKSFLGTKKM
jgi:putative transposase